MPFYQKIKSGKISDKGEMNMASLTGVSGSTTVNDIRGFGGLASGLDRDSLIEGMTKALAIKLNKQNQKKTTIGWQQTAIRNISSKMIAFAEKYTETMTSTTNLFSASFWGSSKMSVLGSNSKYITATGSTKSGQNLSILGVKQLAQKAKLESITKGDNGEILGASDQTLQLGNLDFKSNVEMEILKGKSLTFNVGGTDCTINLSGKFKDADGKETEKEYKFGTVPELKDALDNIFEHTEVTVKGSKEPQKLSTYLSVSEKDGELVFKEEGGTVDVKVKGGSWEALEVLGFKELGKSPVEKEIENGGLSTKIRKLDIVDQLAGKVMDFSFNGTGTRVTLPGIAEFKDENGNLKSDFANPDGTINKTKFLEKLQTSMQTQLDNAYGKTPDGKSKAEVVIIKGENKGENIGIKSNENYSTITLTGGSVALFDEQFGADMKIGESNRLNLSAKINEAGFAKGLTFKQDGQDYDKEGNPVGEPYKYAELNINGTTIKVKDTMTVNQLMDTINKSAAGVTVKYESMSDSFTMTSKTEGSNSKLEVDDAIRDLFGFDKTNGNQARGTDAVFTVNMGGNNMEVTRSSNNFSMDGLDISLKGTFGYTGTGDAATLNPDAEAVTFEAHVETDFIVDTVKKMVTEYNEILELVNKEYTTRPDREYAPLSDEQKKELDKDEIASYEEKAKQGILYNDSNLRALASDLRFIINPENLAAMQEIGLTTSDKYSDNGKLVFDEKKFREALEQDPSKVEKLFTQEGTDTQSAGMAQNMKSVMDKYAKTMGADKGLLIKQAGSEKAATSMIDNKYFHELTAIEKVINKLKDQMQVERDRYIKQFTSLETLISQMNNQSSWLSQFGG